MAAPTQIGNNLNAFVAPSGGFPYANAAAVIELNNGDSVNLTAGMYVNISTATDSLAAPPWPAATHPTATGPVYVQRVSGAVGLTGIGIVVGEAAPPYQQWQSGLAAGVPQQALNVKNPGLVTICVLGIATANVDATTAVTAKSIVSAGTGATAGTVQTTTGTVGQNIGFAITAGAVSTTALLYVVKF